jgi:hypothetical protein
METAEAHALKEFMAQQFVWLPGKYTVTISAKIHELRAMPKATCSFFLSPESVGLLAGNQAGIDWELRRIAGNLTTPPPHNFNWGWVYPNVINSEIGST